MARPKKAEQDDAPDAEALLARNEELEAELAEARRERFESKGAPDGVKYIKEPNDKEKIAHGPGTMAKYATSEAAAKFLESEGWKPE
jgi:hypothetical protein